MEKNQQNKINKYIETGYKWILGLFVDLVKENRKDADRVIKAIADSKTDNGGNIDNLNKNITTGLVLVKKAIQDNSKVEITNPEAIGNGIIDKLGEVVETLKSEIIKIDKNVVIKNDLSSLAVLFKGNKDKEAIITALKAIENKIKYPEQTDYTMLLSEIYDCLEVIKEKETLFPEVNLATVESLLLNISVKNVVSKYETDDGKKIKVVVTNPGDFPTGNGSFSSDKIIAQMATEWGYCADSLTATYQYYFFEDKSLNYKIMRITLTTGVIAYATGTGGYTSVYVNNTSDPTGSPTFGTYGAIF